VNLINIVARNMAGTTLCALGDFAANPIIHTIKNFPDDFKQHVEKKEAEEEKKPAAKPAAAAGAAGRGRVAGQRGGAATRTPAGD
jgi:hypothetical protein